MSKLAKKTTEAAETKAVRSLGVIQRVKRSDCRPSASNPRKTFTKLDELADSMKEQGIRHPLLLRAHPPAFTLHEPDLMDKKNWFVLDRAGKEIFRGPENQCYLNAGGEAGFKAFFEIVDGERRWRASELAKVTELPSIVYGFEEMTDVEVREIQLISFAQREDVSALEEGESFRELIDSGAYTADTLAAKLGKSRSHIFGRLKLATLSPAIKKAVSEGKLNPALGELVARIPGEKLQAKAMKDILEGGPYDYTTQKHDAMSVRHAKDMIERKFMLDLDKATWDLHEKDLVPEVPSCADCPKRTGNAKDLFPDFKNPNVCSDLACFELKRQAKAAKALAKAQETGLKVIPADEAKSLFQYGAEKPYYGYGDKTKFMELGTEVPSDKRERTFKQILGKDAPEPVIVIAPNGTPHKAFLRKDVNEAMKQKGFDFDKKDEAESAKQKADKALEVVRETVCIEALPEVLKHFQKKEALPAALRIAIHVLDESFYDVTEKITKRRGLSGVTTLMKSIKDMSPGELTGLLLEFALEGDDGIFPYGDYTEAFKEACVEACVDLKAKEKAALALKEAEQPKGKVVLHRNPRKKPAGGGGQK